MRQALLWASATALVILATCVVFLPAAWIGNAVAEHSRLRLLHPTGTLWDGSAILAVSDGKNARMLPGRLAWSVQVGAMLRGRISVEVRHPSLEDPVGVSYDGREVFVGDGRLIWPAALLEVLGVPFNTLSPGGELRVQWGGIGVSSQGFSGKVQIDWRDAQSAMSPVVPLGDFRVVADATNGTGEAKLTTVKGPLLLEGQGSLQSGVIRFNGTADSLPEMRAQLNGLIGVLGPRSGQKVLLNWEFRI